MTHYVVTHEPTSTHIATESRSAAHVIGHAVDGYYIEHANVERCNCGADTVHDCERIK